MLVDVEELSIDTYQRPVNARKVQTMVDTWDPVALGSIAVSLRESGEVFVIDGQHRATAARQKGIQQIPALVWYGLTYAQEAAAWVKCQTGQTKPTTIDVFKGRLEMGDESAQTVSKILQSCGFTFNFKGGKNGPYELQAPATIEKIYIDGGEDVLRKTLKIVADVWDGQMTSDMICYVANFLIIYMRHPLFQMPRLENVLRKTSVVDIKSEARHIADRKGGTPMKWGAGVVLDAYNKGLGPTRLPEA